jgi:hypothetical protein
VPEGWKQSEDESIDNQDIMNRDLCWQDENPSMNKTQKSVATHSDVENVDEIETKETEMVRS